MGNKQASKANTTLVSIIAVLSITVGILGLHIYNLKGEVETETLTAQASKSELTHTYQELDELSLRLESQINEIQQLGGKVEALLEIKKQLEHDKYQLQLSKNITLERYHEIKKTVAEYEVLIKQKDNEIAFLQEKNQTLVAKYDSLQGSTEILSDKVNDLKNAHADLSSKVATAAVLQAVNFNLTAISSNGKERTGKEHKVRHIEKLRISFNLAENSLAEVGGRKIYLRIIEPDGKTLFNINTGSGKFKNKGSEEFYTTMQEILFDNSQQMISYLYKKGNDFKKGTHRVEVFCQGYLIGQTTFKVI